MSSFIQIKGIKGAKEALNDFATKGIDTIDAEQLRKLGDALEQDMKSNAPVDTGELRDNTNVASVTDEELIIKSEAPYAGYVNWGTSKMPPRPFFSNPIERIAKTVFPDQLTEAYSKYWSTLVLKFKGT